MKKQILLIFISFIAWVSNAQNNTLKVVNKNLVTPQGQTVVLRGVNYPILDEGSISLSNPSQYQSYIDQVALTGANAIRIPWNTNGVHWRDIQSAGTLDGYIKNGHLENLISYCKQKGMVVILEIHDLTCSNDWNALTSTVLNFWLQQDILDLIDTHKDRLIINIANEMGQAVWTGNVSTAMNTFKTNYNSVIAALRKSGVKVPIMIDAPDCGMSSTELLSVTQDMLTADPEHNLIFSAHTYWYGYANTPTAITTKIQEIVNANVCFVFGEIANRQDVTGNQVDGTYNIDHIYKEVLTQACINNIGWLAWTFNHDWESAREMSATSQFNNLTTYGNDLVYNTTYGLLSGTCKAVSLNTKNIQLSNTIIYPNPTNKFITIETDNDIENVSILDTSGKIISVLQKPSKSIDVSQLSKGVYFIKINKNKNSETLKFIIN